MQVQVPTTSATWGWVCRATGSSHPVWGYTVDCLEILHAVEQLHEVERIDEKSGNPAGNGSYAYLGK